MFSLGLIVIALYNSPHRSPVETGCSVTNYRRIFSSPSTTPTANNNYLCAGNLSKEILASLLPRLLTRRPAQRYSAREFQQARFFDNILVSTIGFLDTFPARSPSEKSQFLRGLPRVLPQFPKAVLEKKILPVLLEETQDPELLSLLLQNVFLVIGMTANSQRTLSELVIPRLKQVFLSGSRGKAQSKERDPLREGGLRIVLENVNLIASNCTGRIFKEGEYLTMRGVLEPSTDECYVQTSYPSFTTLWNRLRTPLLTLLYRQCNSFSLALTSL